MCLFKIRNKVNFFRKEDKHRMPRFFYDGSVTEIVYHKERKRIWRQTEG